MNMPVLDTGFAQGIRDELTAIGTKGSRLQLRQRRTRTVAFALSAVAIAGATTGAAIVVNSFPGATNVEPIGTAVTMTHTGTGSIDLGSVPDSAGVVVIDLTCVNKVGQVFVATTPGDDLGATSTGTDCARADKPLHVDDALLPAAGTTSITVLAEPETTWKATARYATSTTSPWGVNANGQTYGIPNGHGIPDLTPARTADGKAGYVLSAEFLAASPPVGEVLYINVYQADGTTVIGRYGVRTLPSVPVDPDLIPSGVATELPGR